MVAIIINSWDIWCFLQSSKNIISELYEEVNRSTADKWFNYCECSILLASLILENNCSQQYVVPNMLTTSYVWMIRLGNHPDRSIWFLQRLKMSQARNLDYKTSEHWRSMSSICSCTGKILKVRCRAAWMGFRSCLWLAGHDLRTPTLSTVCML